MIFFVYLIITFHIFSVGLKKNCDDAIATISTAEGLAKEVMDETKAAREKIVGRERDVRSARRDVLEREREVTEREIEATEREERLKRCIR